MSQKHLIRVGAVVFRLAGPKGVFLVIFNVESMRHYD